MRKILLLLTLLGLFITEAKAQFPTPSFGPVTHGNGNQLYGGLNVNVQRFFVTSPLQYACGTGPYFIGGGHPEGYQFNFTTRPATHVKLNFADLNQNDEIEIRINGANYNLSGAQLANNALCPAGAPFSGVVNASGNLTSTTGNPVAQIGSVEVVIDGAPGVINNIRVTHLYSTPGAGGAAFSLEFAADTCKQDLTVRGVPRDSVCSSRTLQLSATPFPNTNFTWTGPLGWTGTGTSPTRPNILLTHAGWYVATGIRGVCTYKDSVNITVLSTPIKPFLTASNIPLCKGDSLYMIAATTGAVGVDWYWSGPNGFTDLDNEVSIPGFQPALNAGIYSVYAVSEGCTSDIANFNVTQHPEVTASFDYLIKEGCTVDTIIFTNTSVGQSASDWYILGQPNPYIGSDNNATWTYYRPYNPKDPDGEQVTFKLVASSFCKDSMSKLPTDILHPLLPQFDASDTSICQNATTIDFTNTTIPAGPYWTHSYEWDMRDGSPVVNTFNTSHLYSLAGVYKARLKLTAKRNDLLIDPTYVGCIDSFEKTIYVDSTGEITFTATDTVLCAGNTIGFEGVYSRLGSRTVQWGFGDGNVIDDLSSVVYTYDKPGVYPVTFTLFNNICPNAVTTKEVTIKPFPKVDLGDDTSMCPNGSPIVIRDRVEQDPDVKYIWNTKTRDITPSVTVRGPGVYALSADLNGCVTTDSVTIFKDCYIDLPNVFSPDGDGNNEYFLPRQFLSKSVKSYRMMVFNRWGVQMFETTNINGRGWDGKFNDEPQPTGVYIYTIEVTFDNNTNERYQGNVTLLR